MRIVMVNDYFGHSAGAFAVAWSLSGELIRRGHEVYFVCADEGRARTNFDEVDGRGVFRLAARTPFRLRPALSIYHPGLVGRAADLIHRLRPDAVHAHVLHLNLSLGLVGALRRRGLETILSAHDTGIFCPTKYTCQPAGDPARPATIRQCLACQRFRYLPGRRLLGRRRVNGQAKAVVAVSRSLAAILTANGVARVEVVHNGLDPARLENRGQSGAEFRAAYKLGDEPFILFGGRLQREKGDEAAIRALAAMDRNPETKLIVAGKRELFGPRLQKLATRLGVEDRIVRVGWLDREAMLGAYRASRAVLVPSLYPDPFPTVNLEAMALARPVVGTIFGGTPEAVADGETGFLVDPADSVQVGRRLSELISDPALAARMGKAGRARLEEKFSQAGQADRFEAIYTR